MSGGEAVSVLGICGSLRRGSYNAAALRAAEELAPEGLRIEQASIAEVPLYNEDLRLASGFPPAVEALREKIRAADAVLIATPEYNYSVPGVLKNAIDWISRPPEQPFSGKPIALMGASPGRLGTARAQYHLRQIFVFLNAYVMNQPEIFIADAPARFDTEGRLADEPTRSLLKTFLVALRAWALRFKR
ncbi:MAG: NAD(P)H-dependent oxidoreductase [Acidobacteriia bacterium]|nr:NAD(P)H-dependent oxidoreductase [Methyloceanibacter sp.]MBX5471490.1 NAD(P)H-dependent oxidoreductase [Acetobacteraceae bacterium]MCL6490868.1 NAD(P)H-dependent oxidoreductase [Terriglobia bacterium]